MIILAQDRTIILEAHPLKSPLVTMTGETRYARRTYFQPHVVVGRHVVLLTVVNVKSIVEPAVIVASVMMVQTAVRSVDQIFIMSTCRYMYKIDGGVKFYFGHIL
jgi:hypothetical protein